MQGSTPIGGADPVAGNTVPLADSFFTGATGYTLTDVTLSLVLQGSATGSIAVELLSDSSTSPGSILATIGTINDSAVGFDPANYDFAVSPTIALAAMTRYWIEVVDGGGPSASSIAWTWANDLSGTGVLTSGGGEYNVNAASQAVEQNSLSNLPYQMGVFGTPSSVIPEPSSVVLLGLGLGAIAAVGRYRGRRAA